MFLFIKQSHLPQSCLTCFSFCKGSAFASRAKFTPISCVSQPPRSRAASGGDRNLLQTSSCKGQPRRSLTDTSHFPTLCRDVTGNIKMGNGTTSPALMSGGELIQLNLMWTHMGLGGLHPSPISTASLIASCPEEGVVGRCWCPHRDPALRDLSCHLPVLLFHSKKWQFAGKVFVQLQIPLPWGARGGLGPTHGAAQGLWKTHRILWSRCIKPTFSFCLVLASWRPEYAAYI